MSDNTSIKPAIVNFPEVPDSVDNALKNITDEPTKNAGKTFGDIWYLVFGGISYLADKRRMEYAAKLEQFKSELDESLSKIPPEKQIEPSIQITAQALENSKYCVEEKTLRDMFTNLISNSMNSDYQKFVHPSFAEMIKQMSPVDALLLKKIKTNIVTGFPVCDYRLRSPKGGYYVLLEKIFLEIPSVDIPLCAQALTSLERFGLISIPYGTYINDTDCYKKFEEHPLFQFYKDFYAEKGELYVEKTKTVLTPLGRSFVNSCISD